MSVKTNWNRSSRNNTVTSTTAAGKEKAISLLRNTALNTEMPIYQWINAHSMLTTNCPTIAVD